MSVLISSNAYLDYGGAILETSGGDKIAVLLYPATQIEIWSNIDSTPNLDDYNDFSTIHGAGNVLAVHAAIDSNDVIHVVSCTNNIAADRDIAYCVATQSGGTYSFGTWEQVAPYTDSYGAFSGVNIAVDSNDKPHVVYTDSVTVKGATSHNTYYCEKTTGSWSSPEQVGARPSKEDYYEEPVITVRNSDIVEVTHKANISSVTYLAYRTCTSGSWNSEATYMTYDMDNAVPGILSTTSGTVYRIYGRGANYDINENLTDTGYDYRGIVRHSISAVLVGGSDRYILYIDSDDDVHYIYNSGSGWTDGDDLETGTYRYVIANWSYNNYNTSNKIIYLFSYTSGAYYGSLSLVSGTATSDSADAYLRGSTSSADSYDAYTRGSQDVSGSADAYTEGIAGIADSKSAYLAGLDTASSSRDAYLEGSQDASGSVDAYLCGSEDVADSRSAYSRGSEDAVDSTSAYTSGIQGSSDSLSAFTHGKQDTQDDKSAYLVGSIDVSDSTDAYMAGSVDVTDSMSAYIVSAFDVTDSNSAFTAGIADTSGSIDAYLVGSEEASNSTDVYVHGAETASDSQDAYTSGTSAAVAQPAISATRFLVPKGKRSSSGAYTQGVAIASSSVDAYTAGTAIASDSTDAYLAGIDSTSDSRDAYLLGSMDADDSIDAYLSGLDVASSSMHAFLEGGGNTADDSQDAYLCGVSTGVSAKHAYTRGSSTASDSADAYLFGVIAASSSMHAYIVSPVQVFSVKHAYTEGFFVDVDDSISAYLEGYGLWPFTDDFTGSDEDPWNQTKWQTEEQ